MKKQRICKTLCLSLIIVLIVLLLSSCLFTNELEEYFLSWVPEKDENIAIVLDKNRVIIGEKTIDVADALSRYYYSVPNFDYEDSCKLDQILLVKDNKIYGSKSYSLSKENAYRFGIDIYAIDINNTDIIEKIYSGEHFSKSEENRYEYVSRNEKTYYSNGDIVIYDGFDYTIINVDTKEVRKVSPCEYEPTNCKYDIKWVENGYEIMYGTDRREITFEYLAERNEYLASLKTLQNEYHYRNISPLEHFWHNKYVFGDTIYFVLDVLEPDGESNALLVSYNVTTDSVAFLYHYYTADIPSCHIYPIPRQNNTGDGGLSLLR